MRAALVAGALALAFLGGDPATASAQLPDVPTPSPATGPVTPSDEPGSDVPRGSDERGASALYGIPGRNALSLPGPVDPRIYLVGPGDLLLLQLWGRVSRSVPLEVGPEGTIMIPGAGTMNLEGRTLSEVREQVLTRVRSQFRGVNMDLRLARPRSFRVYLTGQVRSPGPVDANGTSRVGDALAGSALLDHASRRRIEILRRNGERQIADLGLFHRTGDQSLNPWLHDGDVIQVPTATQFVYAQGAVAQPGRYELGPRDSLRTLLRLAGDPLPAAEAGRALFVKFRDAYTPESLWVTLDDVYSGRVNPPLEDGERVYVYFIPQYHQQDEAVIVGEVERPGTYPIVEGRTRLSMLVHAADGFLPSADLSAIRVHRLNPAAAEKDPELERLLRLSRNELTATEYEQLRTKLASLREDYRVDWTRLKSDAELDLLLRDGDVVRVERLVSSIRIDGEVRRPGILTYTPGQSVRDYIRQAGGVTDRAWSGKIRVTRAVTGQTFLARNLKTLDPGDFVWVPEKPDVTAWEQAKEVLTALASVATVVIAIRSVQ